MHQQDKEDKCKIEEIYAHQSEQRIRTGSLRPYWRNEPFGERNKSSDKLASSVKKFLLTTESLTSSDVALIRGYLQFWSNCPWEGLDESELFKLQDLCDRIASRSTIETWLDYAGQNAIHPF